MDIKLNILKHLTTSIISAKDPIITRWIEDESVKQLLLHYHINGEFFKEKYAYKVLDYYLDVLHGIQAIGECPTMMELLKYFQEKNISSSELYTICINFRESLIKEFIQQDLLNDEIYDALSYVFDANFTGLFKIYSDTIYKTKQTAQEFQNLVNNSLNEIYIFDTKTLQFTYVNRGATLNTGYSKDEFKQMAPYDIKPEFYNEQKFRKIIQPLIEHTQEYLILQTQHQRKDGTLYDVDIRLQLMQFESKEKFVAIINDITDRLKAEKEKEHYYELATHDYLTKIYNRQKFDTLCNLEFERSKRYGYEMSLILLDIDNFKDINDRFGHKTGDTVLIKMTQLISSELRESDIFARWGGEEFVILLPHSNLDLGVKKAESLRKKIETAQIETVDKITCSFGVSKFNPLHDSQKLFIDADAALYKAKTNGKNRVEQAL